jgi:hypothetical protein
MSDEFPQIYIGSTINTLSDRLAQHKHHLKYYMSSKKLDMCSSSILLMADPNSKIILIENFPCKTKEELRARERYYIEQNRELCININIPNRTKKEYRTAYKDQINQQKKKYYIKNSVMLCVKKREVIKCACGRTTTRTNLSRHNQTSKHKKIMAAHTK